MGGTGSLLLLFITRSPLMLRLLLCALLLLTSIFAASNAQVVNNYEDCRDVPLPVGVGDLTACIALHQPDCSHLFFAGNISGDLVEQYDIDPFNYTLDLNEIFVNRGADVPVEVVLPSDLGTCDVDLELYNVQGDAADWTGCLRFSGQCSVQNFPPLSLGNDNELGCWHFPIPACAGVVTPSPSLRPGASRSAAPTSIPASSGGTTNDGSNGGGQNGHTGVIVAFVLLGVCALVVFFALVAFGAYSLIKRRNGDASRRTMSSVDPGDESTNSLLDE